MRDIIYKMGSFESKSSNIIQPVNSLESKNGTWYEISRFPFAFENDQCDSARVILSDRIEKSIKSASNSSLNIQYETYDMLNQIVSTRYGIVKIEDEKTGKLQIEFLKETFKTECYLVDCGPEYNHDNLMVFVNDHKTVLWIWSRSKTFTRLEYSHLKTKLQYIFHLNTDALVSHKQSIIFN